MCPFNYWEGILWAQSGLILIPKCVDTNKNNLFVFVLTLLLLGGLPPPSGVLSRETFLNQLLAISWRKCSREKTFARLAKVKSLLQSSTLFSESALDNFLENPF